MKTVLITGANRGIGLATSRLLKKRKYNVIGVARSKVKNFPGKFIECDLSNTNEIELLIKQLKKLNITCIVNNAGASFGQSIENLDLKTFDKSIQLNLRPAIQLSLGLVKNMKKRKFGRIVNVASRAALGRELRTSYSSAKAGLYGFARTWALELAKFNITINTVSPGPILTELFPDAPTRKDELYAVSSANFRVDDSAYEPKLMFIIVAPFSDAYSTPAAIFVELPCPVD